MAGVVIEELDNSSEEEFSTPKAEHEEPVYHDAEQHIGRSDQANGSSNAPSSPAQAPAGAGYGSTGHVKEDAEAPSTSQDVVEAEEESKELTAEETAKLEQAEQLKLEGNALYGSGNYDEALAKYQSALDTAPEKAPQQRAVFFANSAAARLKLEEFAEAAKDCSAALALEPPPSLQIKALTRRSQAYERLDDLDRALADYEKVVQLDPSNRPARAAMERLKPIVEERREKMKDEMMGKLKELGNTVLGKFGMSLDNFKAEKDPQTGAYSINFKQ